MHTNYTRENSDVSDTGDFFYFNLNVSSSGGFRGGSGGSLEPPRSPPPTVFKYPIKMK